MSKKWYSYFVSVDPGTAETTAGEEAGAPVPETRSAAQAVADIAASVKPAPSFTRPVADPASFKDIKDVRIKKDAVDPEDVETLQDLVRAAFSDALAKSREVAAQRMGSVTGGLKLPGM